MQLLAVQPIGVAIYSNTRCLMSYSHGVILEKDCDCSDVSREVNHGVVVVGYGKANMKECEDYWIVKNSWGSNWGEKGFFKICADRTTNNANKNKFKWGMCQINAYAMWPSLD